MLSASPDVHCGCRHVSEFTSYNLHNLPYDACWAPQLCVLQVILCLLHAGVSSFVGLFRTLSLFSIVRVLAHGLNAGVTVRLAVSVQPQAAKPTVARTLLK